MADETSSPKPEEPLTTGSAMAGPERADAERADAEAASSEVAAPTAAPASTSQAATKPLPNLRTLVSQALVVAMTPLIPVPFLDDWTRDRLRRWQVSQRAQKQGVQLSDEAIATVAVGKRPFDLQGCLQGCALTSVFKAAFYVVKKLSLKMFRKIVIFLMIKDCANQFARTLDEGILLEHLLQGPGLRGQPSPESLRRFREALDTAMSEVGRGPIEQIARATFSGSRGLIRHAGRVLSRRLRFLRKSGAADAKVSAELEREGEAELGSLIDTLTHELRDETAYFDRLIAAFETALARR